MPAEKPVVLHVVAYDVSRGAERYARDLIDTLNARGEVAHLLMTMFRGDEDNLAADIALDVPRGLLRRVGFDPRVVSRMRRSIGEVSPVAVVAHGGEPAKYAALAAGDVPFVYLVIGSSHPLLSNPIRRMVRKFYVGEAAAIVTVSSALATEIESEFGGTGARLYVIPNGRDPDIYRPGDPDGDSPPHVLFIGHLDEQKRPRLFVDVMSEMARRGVPATAALVGGGPLLGEVTLAAAPLGIETLGPRDDVPRLLARADLLVVTSRPPEGMPGVLIEAGMSGLAVVTTDVPGARDVVVDGITGLVVGVDDEAGLADAVEAMLVDEDARSKMGRAARERCVAEFSLDNSADVWEQVLEEVKP